MFNILKTKSLFLLISLMLIPNVLLAEGKIDSADTAWMMISTGLVLLMIPGLAFFYGGMSRSNHVLSVVMHSIFAMGIMTIQWYVIGYSLAWGGDTGGFIGNLDYLFLITWEQNPTEQFPMFYL